METLLLINLIIGTGVANIPNGYIEAGLAWHHTADLPEVNLDPTIAQWEFGIQTKHVKYFYQHTSGVVTTEVGLGLNAIGFKIKFK